MVCVIALIGPPARMLFQERTVLSHGKGRRAADASIATQASIKTRPASQKTNSVRVLGMGSTEKRTQFEAVRLQFPCKNAQLAEENPRTVASAVESRLASRECRHDLVLGRSPGLHST